MGKKSLFNAAIAGKNTGRPPVWFMRQAGRYHAHYQNLKKQHSFIGLCKKPELACETTMGPIRDFDFDAAILFSDLLFPLEVMGMGLSYDPGPKLSWHLNSLSAADKLLGGKKLASQLQFQGDAIRLIRKELDSSKGLLGFVGGPLTLYCYAVEGHHSGALASARVGLIDGRYESFVEKLQDCLIENMVIQAQAGADAIAIFDTCAGEFDVALYSKFAVPALRAVCEGFKAICPNTPIVYYSKGTDQTYWDKVARLPISCLGIDWHQDLASVLVNRLANQAFAIQGNVDPDWLLLEANELEKRLRLYFEKIRSLPASCREGWICGLGHGVLQKTPESNIRLFVRLQREMFG